MGNIQEKVHRLVACCRMCAVLGLGKVSIERNGRFSIEKQERITYRFESFDELEAFLEETLLRKSKGGHIRNKSVNHRITFLKEKERAECAGMDAVKMYSIV